MGAFCGSLGVELDDRGRHPNGSYCCDLLVGNPTILQLTPAPAGWRAIFEEKDQTYSEHIVAWALIQDCDFNRSIVPVITCDGRSALELARLVHRLVAPGEEE